MSQPEELPLEDVPLDDPRHMKYLKICFVCQAEAKPNKVLHNIMNHFLPVFRKIENFISGKKHIYVGRCPCASTIKHSKFIRKLSSIDIFEGTPLPPKIIKKGQRGPIHSTRTNYQPGANPTNFEFTATSPACM
jgi:hypothetical protein